VGVKSVFDFTPIMAGRKPAELRRLSREVGMHIVTGTGYYRQAFTTPDVAGMSVDDLEQKLLGEVTEGIEGTGVRAGLIGELGTTKDGISAQEQRVLIAAARVQRQTNVPVVLHTEGRREVILAAIKLLTDNGASATRIHICHVNGAPFWKDIADTGATIGHDCFGSTFSIDSETKMNPTDQDRIDQVKRMFDAGYGHRVLISNDICMKSRMHKYGGWGYDHIQTNLFSFFTKAGFSDSDLDQLFIQNPRRLVDTAT
jgi:phosphotriesterase-related protein